MLDHMSIPWSIDAARGVIGGWPECGVDEGGVWGDNVVEGIPEELLYGDVLYDDSRLFSIKKHGFGIFIFYNTFSM